MIRRILHEAEADHNSYRTNPSFNIPVNPDSSTQHMNELRRILGELREQVTKAEEEIAWLQSQGQQPLPMSAQPTVESAHHSPAEKITLFLAACRTEKTGFFDFPPAVILAEQEIGRESSFVRRSFG